MEFQPMRGRLAPDMRVARWEMCPKHAPRLLRLAQPVRYQIPLLHVCLLFATPLLTPLELSRLGGVPSYRFIDRIPDWWSYLRRLRLVRKLVAFGP